LDKEQKYHAEVDSGYEFGNTALYLRVMNMLQSSLLLVSNFSDDPLFRFAFTGPETNRHRGMEAYFSAALDYCLQEGSIIIAPENRGLLAWIPGSAFPPHIDQTRIRNQPSYVQEAWERLNNHESTPETIIAANANSFAYCWLLTVDFSVRGKGYGRMLMENGFDQMREAGLKECWLSTENNCNNAFYELHGMELFESAAASSGLTSYIFRKSL
jgi:ribosomal protein S18 acetylase RimI-like enzyme